MIAIKNGRIVTPNEIIENKTLLIHKDRIINICNSDIKAKKTIMLTVDTSCPDL